MGRCSRVIANIFYPDFISAVTSLIKFIKYGKSIANTVELRYSIKGMIINYGVGKMSSLRIIPKSQGGGNSAYFVMPFMRMNNGVLRPLHNSGRYAPFCFRMAMNEGGRPP